MRISFHAKALQIAALILIAVCTISAQTPAGQATQTSAEPPAPTASLPGDTPQPSLDFQLHVSTGPETGTPPATRPAEITTGLTLELATDAAQAALSVCHTDGYPVAVALTDETGKLIVAMTDNGVLPGRVFTAIRKSLTAAAFKQSTTALRPKVLADPALRADLKPNMSLFPGGLPIMIGTRVLGAIGVSGAFGNEEDMCARKGIDKIQTRLK